MNEQTCLIHGAHSSFYANDEKHFQECGTIILPRNRMIVRLSIARILNCDSGKTWIVVIARIVFGGAIYPRTRPIIICGSSTETRAPFVGMTWVIDSVRMTRHLCDSNRRGTSDTLRDG